MAGAGCPEIDVTAAGAAVHNAYLADVASIDGSSRWK
jgi:hypothetical protein